MTTMIHDMVVRIAARGDGVTGAGVHVPRAAPGDWLDATGVLHHGPHHVAPPCPHFGRCGGCQLQHADDVALDQFVRDRVVHALAAQGVTCHDVRPAYLSPPQSRRRAALRAQRQGRQLRLGYSEGGSHRLINLTQCDILHPNLFAQLAPMRALLLALMGPRGSATVQMTMIDQGVDVLISGVDGFGLAAHDAILAFCTAGEIARLAIDAGDGPEDRWAPEPATLTIGAVAVPFPHAAFLQATTDGQNQLVAAVDEAVADSAHVADLFSGIGTFGLSLRAHTKVHAAEAARSAVLALQSGANRHQRAVTVEHRDLYRRPLTAQELTRFDAVILDPPRAGAAEQVAAIAQSKVPSIAYVSCNPTSFARDAAVLIAGGYALAWVRPVGQFRWSTHVELAAHFVRS